MCVIRQYYNTCRVHTPHTKYYIYIGFNSSAQLAPVFTTGEKSKMTVAAAAVMTMMATAFTPLTGYYISIINPFILLTFITRLNVVDGDNDDGDDNDDGSWLLAMYALRIYALAYHRKFCIKCAHQVLFSIRLHIAINIWHTSVASKEKRTFLNKK